MESDWGNAQLAHCRTRIDELDRRLLELLNQRTRLLDELALAGQCVPSRPEQAFASEAVRRLFEGIVDEMAGERRSMYGQ